MKYLDDTAIKKMEKLISVIAETENLGASDSELSEDELDKVTGGVGIPDFQQFLQYARNRKAKESQDM